MYESRLKSFEYQHEDGIARQNHSGTTIVYALKNICENCSHFRRSVVDNHLCQSMSVVL